MRGLKKPFYPGSRGLVLGSVSQSSKHGLRIHESCTSGCPQLQVMHFTESGSGLTNQPCFDDINQLSDARTGLIFSPVIEPGADITIPIQHKPTAAMYGDHLRNYVCVFACVWMYSYCIRTMLADRGLLIVGSMLRIALQVRLGYCIHGRLQQLADLQLISLLRGRLNGAMKQ